MFESFKYWLKLFDNNFTVYILDFSQTIYLLNIILTCGSVIFSELSAIVVSWTVHCLTSECCYHSAVLSYQLGYLYSVSSCNIPNYGWRLLSCSAYVRG